MNENATSFIFNENYEGAVELLENSILLLKQINASSQVGNALIILLSHHNLALCYQKFFYSLGKLFKGDFKAVNKSY